ncbi:MAG: hypothetical protein SGPRY_009909, partial [Prymnesium sp.]
MGASLPTILTYLAELFQSQQLLDDSDTRFRELAQPRFEAAIRSLFRARSQKLVPLETAALTIQWLHYRVPSPVWNSISYLSRMVMSYDWAEGIADKAAAKDPGPTYEVAQGITAAVFENLTMQSDYSSFATTTASGAQMNMTNLSTAFVPTLAIPDGFDIDKMLGGGGLFRQDLKLPDFLDLFSIHHLAMIAHQRTRWSEWLDAAARNDIWDKKTYDSPYSPTKFHYHDPIFGRLQASYDDVNFELNLMKNSRFH